MRHEWLAPQEMYISPYSTKYPNLSDLRSDDAGLGIQIAHLLSAGHSFALQRKSSLPLGPYEVLWIHQLSCMQWNSVPTGSIRR